MPGMEADHTAFALNSFGKEEVAGLRVADLRGKSMIERGL
jgi:hypothetical protein